MVLDSEARAVLRRAVDQLAAAGARVEEAHPPIDVEPALRTYFFLLGAAMGSGDPTAVGIGRSMPPATPDEPVEAGFTRGAAADLVAWNAAREAQAAVRRAWARFQDTYDVLLCPVTPTAALPTEAGRGINERTMTIDGAERPAIELIRWAGIIGLAYLPSTVIPVGATAAGLPMGMQIVGPYFEDRTTLDVARRADGVLGAYRVPPLAML
jgi:amidase